MPQRRSRGSKKMRSRGPAISNDGGVSPACVYRSRSETVEGSSTRSRSSTWEVASGVRMRASPSLATSNSLDLGATSWGSYHGTAGRANLTPAVPRGIRDGSHAEMALHPLAGRPPPPEMLANVPRLVTEYYVRRPDPDDPGERVAFGTSGHRGSSLRGSFNEAHILAASQAVVEERHAQGVTGPLFLGIDTHALSEPAFASALEVLAANGIDVVVQEGRGYTPTPVVSRAILRHNRGRGSGLADGIVVTPSHNPPDDGGFKYDPTHGGPADTAVTRRIEDRANALLRERLAGVKRIPFERALRAETTHWRDYV